MAQPRTPAVGIDLGTTFSAVACLDDSGRPQTLLSAEGDRVTPSVVLFDEAAVVVGKEAVKAMSSEADRVADCVKRELGRRAYSKTLGGQSYPPEVLQAWILDKLAEDSRRQIGAYEKAVITVPAYFDEVRRKATQDAGYMAGLDVMDIINEPTAAAVAFGFQQGRMGSGGDFAQRERILVYDLGGGTFDVTVMEIGGGDFCALATDGDVQLGGRDWDQRLIDHVAEQFLRKHGADPREDSNTAARLWRECEDAKRTLAARDKASVACEHRGRTIRLDVTRDAFQEMTRDLLDRTAFTTRHTLQAAGLQWKDIDRVLLAGGATRMPAVRDLLHQLSGKQPDCSVSPDEAVAHGAALHAGLLLAKFAGEPPRFRIKNINSHSLGVAATHSATKRRRNAILIPRNTPLPASAKRVFKTHKAAQRSVLVQIVEGESTSPDDCSQVGKCSIRDLPPDLPADTPIEVLFRYRENGRLTVRVNVAGADKELKHVISRDSGATQRELDSWRKRISGRAP